MAAETSKQFSTQAGIPLKDLYTPEDIKGLDYERDLGYPGQPPYTRGVYKTMYRGQNFTLRRFSGVESPELTNKLFLEEIALGQNGLAIAPDVPSALGFDSDNPRMIGDVGFCGVPIDHVGDMETIFKGIDISKITTWTYLPHITGLYFAMAERQGYDLKKIGGSTPSLGWATGATLDYHGRMSIEGERRMGTDFALWCAEHVPQWHNTSISVYSVKDNGCNSIQELGTLMAATIEAADYWKKSGLDLNAFFKRISFEMAIQNDFFEEICKVRAARRMWSKICRERYGITDPKLMQFRVRVQTSGSTNVAQEPLNNIVRIAYHMLGGCLAGAQAMHPNGYDEALCIPTDQSMLISIRTVQILTEETNVTATIDPLAGSYYVEWLTNEMEKRANEYMQKLFDMGGTCEAQRKGFFYNEYKKANRDWDSKVDSGERVVVGVNKYRMKQEEVPYKVPVYKFKPTAADEQIAKLVAYKKSRDNSKVEAALKHIDKVCRSEKENIFAAILAAYKVGVTMQEAVDVCRNVYGLDSTVLMKV